MSILVAAISTPTLQLIQPEPRATITVASGLDGRRGSYIFSGLLLDPADAVSYIEITQNPDVRPLEYDMYVSTGDGSQWQYRYNGSGGLEWFFLARSTPVQVQTHEVVLPADHLVSELITHNLGTRNVDAIVYRNASPYTRVFCGVEHTSTNTVTLKFSNSEPVPSALKVVIVAYL